jgi:hypothetical protein
MIDNSVPDVVEIDDVLGKVYNKRGTFRDFWEALTESQKNILLDMKITDGAMDWQQIGEGFTLELH